MRGGGMFEVSSKRFRWEGETWVKIRIQVCVGEGGIMEKQKTYTIHSTHDWKVKMNLSLR